MTFHPEEEGIVISQAEAVETARRWLEETSGSLADRTPTVTRKDTYVVVFPPSGTMRSGDFTVVVDPGTGKVLGVLIER